jgi:hypothetical protein
MPAHVAITFGTPIFPSTLVTGSTTDAENIQESSETRSPTTGDNGDAGMTSAEALILQWGQQVVTLSGHPDFQVELASKRKRRTHAKS